MNRYPENEYGYTQYTSMAGELIRNQAEQIHETPAEYLATQYGTRSVVVDSQRNN